MGAAGMISGVPVPQNVYGAMGQGMMNVGGLWNQGMAPYNQARALNTYGYFGR